MNMPESKLTKAQKKRFTKRIDYDGADADIVVEVRHDDECGNGHNSFTITGTIYKHGRRSGSAWLVGGCIHDEIEKYFPELAQYTKWHLCSTDGPVHYVVNSLYHAKAISKHQDKYFVYHENLNIGIRKVLFGIHSLAEIEQIRDKYPGTITTKEHFNSMAKETDLQAARNSAIWPEAELEDFTRDALEARLPALLVEFKKVVESLGFEY